MKASHLSLARFLDQLQDQYHRTSLLHSDPLEFVHHYQDPWDQESVGLLAALLAYGNVKQIRKSVEEALRRIHLEASSPKDFVRGLGKAAYRKKAGKLFQGYVHRFNSGMDLVLLLELLSRSWSKHGSLGGHFTSAMDEETDHIGSPLSALISEWKSARIDLSGASPGFTHLLTSPTDGSCCKRWCMYLRWMGRRDSLDPGLWTQNGPLASTFQKGKFLHSRQLVMPLDTHTSRISQYLSLTSRKTVTWKTALEVTQALKRLDPEDPTRYDFALSRLGILDVCKRTYREEICKKCQLLPACKFSNGVSASTRC